MTDPFTPPEIERVAVPRAACDGASDLAAMASLGHPRVWLQIGPQGFADCGYCDRRFVLIGGPADVGANVGEADL